jgi:hypothetical protein
VPSHIAFLTLFLGLVSGKQDVELRADSSIASIRIMLAGQEIARVTQPPWRTEIDLGRELVPRELQAIGYDATGKEVGRASQALNVPHESAEVDIELQRSGAFPDGAQLRWRNLEYASPKSATVTFDGAPLRVDSEFRVRFPKTDWARPHIVDAMMRFADGLVARHEAVIDGVTFSDTARAELTPTLLTEIRTPHPSSFDACFSIDGASVRAAAVEKENAIAIFVRDPDASETIQAIDPALRSINVHTRREVSSWIRLDGDTAQQIFWPIASRYDSGSREKSLLFRRTMEMVPAEGIMSLLVGEAPFDRNVGAKMYADAVAVAGVSAMASGRRRAVVLVLNERADASRSSPATVRRYLASIGVPLFVWSPTPASPDATARWGTIDDISTVDHLRAAVARLKQTLAAQRVAWIHADAFSALRVKADERCGFATVAR